MRPLFALLLLAACSSEPAATPDAAAPADVAVIEDTALDVAAPDAPGDGATTDVAPDAAPMDVSAEASTPDAAVADTAQEAGPDVSAVDAPSDSAAVGDAAGDAGVDAPEGSMNCGLREPPCRSSADCAACIPATSGRAWCCGPGNLCRLVNETFCR